MADKSEKWMGAARKRMERKGTVGSLRAIAQRRGLLSGKKDTLTESDIRSLYASAQRSDDTTLIRKVVQAANMMKVSLPKTKEKK